MAARKRTGCGLPASLAEPAWLHVRQMSACAATSGWLNISNFLLVPAVVQGNIHGMHVFLRNAMYYQGNTPV